MNDPVSPRKEKSAPLNLKGAAPKDEELAQLREKLRGALPALAQPELRRDLWPDMLRRLDEGDVRGWRVPWFDWALLAVSAAAAMIFPALIPALLYHL